MTGYFDDLASALRRSDVTGAELAETLEFPEQADPASQASRIKQALEERMLAVEADGALVVFPFENIKYLQAYPAPKKLPERITGRSGTGLIENGSTSSEWAWTTACTSGRASKMPP